MKRNNDTQLIESICHHLDVSVANLSMHERYMLDSARTDAINLAATAVEPELPPAINARLDEIRQRAITHYQTQQQSRSLWDSGRKLLNQLLSATRQPLTAGVFATAGITVTLVSMFYFAPDSNQIPLEQEIALVASAEEIELYENLDFYMWLAENGIPN